jgi:glycerol 3-phosphatase-2
VAQRCPPGSRVLAVGGPGVWLALQEAGLTPVSTQPGSGQVSPARVSRAQTDSGKTDFARADTRQGDAAQTDFAPEGTGQPVVAVVQGYGAGVGWVDLAEAAYAVQDGRSGSLRTRTTPFPQTEASHPETARW